MAIVSWVWLGSLCGMARRSGNSASHHTRLADASAGGAGVECWLRQVQLDFAAHTTLDRAPSRQPRLIRCASHAPALPGSFTPPLRPGEPRSQISGFV